jgi:F-type H+-transporting ATPase subunit gamma
LYILITADRGLCGGYNVNAIKAAMEDVEKDYKSTFITIGKKGTDVFEKSGISVTKSYIYISENPTYQDAQNIANDALKMYKSEQVDEIKLIYTRLISTISQHPTMLKLLPVVNEIKDDEEKEITDFVTYEPSAESVIEFLIPKYIESTIYGALIESAAAEQAARRIAMENATDNADEMLENLTLSFNQARQAAITQEISEIVSGAEALK